MSRARPAGLAAATARSDRQFGLVVEEADALGVERQPQLVVELRAHGRLDARDDDGLPDLDVEQDLGPERLDDLHDRVEGVVGRVVAGDRKSTRLNSSHLVISYAVFCLKKKKTKVCS